MTARARTIEIATIRRRDRIEALQRDATREHAESLLRGIDALTRKFADLGIVPLDVLDRAERIAVAWHSSNLLRLDDYLPDDFQRAERDE